MNCIKRLGERLMSRTFERQVGELHIRAAILNRFMQQRPAETVPIAAVEVGKSLAAGAEATRSDTVSAMQSAGTVLA